MTEGFFRVFLSFKQLALLHRIHNALFVHVELVGIWDLLNSPTPLPTILLITSLNIIRECTFHYHHPPRLGHVLHFALFTINPRLVHSPSSSSSLSTLNYQCNHHTRHKTSFHRCQSPSSQCPSPNYRFQLPPSLQCRPLQQSYSTPPP